MGFLIYNIFINKNIMKKVIRLTESDLTRIVRRVIMEQSETCSGCIRSAANNSGISDITEENINKLIDLLGSRKVEEIKLEDITPMLPSMSDFFKGAKFLMALFDCMEKCNANIRL